MSEEKQPVRQYRRRSLFGPLMLIIIGIVFLLNNLNLTKGDAWGTILNLWPVLLIVAGLDGLLRGEGLVGSAFTISIGTVFLLANLGYLALDVWQIILRLWPLLIVSWGLDLIVGRRSLIAAGLGIIVILGLLVVGLWGYGAFAPAGTDLNTEQVSQQVNGATRAVISITPGVGELRLQSMAEPGGLVTGTVANRTRGRVLQDFSQQGGVAKYSLRSPNPSTIYIGADMNQGWTWDLRLTREIPIDLNVSLGAGEAMLNLTGLKLANLDSSLGVGQITVILPAEGVYDAKISAAIGQVIVEIPEGLAARIKTGTALAGVQVPAGYVKDGNTYTSPGFTSAANRVELDLSLAIGSVVIK